MDRSRRSSRSAEVLWSLRIGAPRLIVTRIFSVFRRTPKTLAISWEQSSSVTTTNNKVIYATEEKVPEDLRAVLLRLGINEQARGDRLRRGLARLVRVGRYLR